MLTWLRTFVRLIRAGRRRTRQGADPLLSSDAERAHAHATADYYNRVGDPAM
jgi:hypothetical protein